MTSEELLAVLAAVGHAQRLRVVAELAEGRLYVSELARRLGMSRPLLYMHLERLEKAGLVRGNLELSEDGKALKYFELAPFDLHLNVDTILAAVAQDAVAAESGTEAGGAAGPKQSSESKPKGKRT
ncbi:ArsR/SmtB family transcription factor [Streptomyces sp. NPDC015125]|uniref:ArsR/SmtB family transcription factor n=1 Tax=Streptomyces sp. NPDC015125 TaxID=3364938 RepID=UPI003702B6D2